jgi:hypothetical protein
MTLATLAAWKSVNRRQEIRFRRHAAHKGLGRHRKEKGLASKLDQLRAMTTVVADTGDLGAVARLKPVDCTTNPTIVLKAVDAPDYLDVVDEALAWGRIGIGGNLAAPPLPHHRTYGSVYGGSRSCH